jgi:hypothetical protein
MAVASVALYSFPAHRLVSFNVGVGARLRQYNLPSSVAGNDEFRKVKAAAAVTRTDAAT